MLKYNPEMIWFVDHAIWTFGGTWVFNCLALAVMKIKFSSPNPALRVEGRFMTQVNFLYYIIVIGRIGLSGYGIRYTWTKE